LSQYLQKGPELKDCSNVYAYAFSTKKSGMLTSCFNWEKAKNQEVELLHISPLLHCFNSCIEVFPMVYYYSNICTIISLEKMEEICLNDI